MTTSSFEIQDEIKSAAQFAQYLFFRWQDEKEFENFEEYKIAMQKRLPEGSVMTKFGKKPWCVEFTLADGTRKWIKATSRMYQWGGYAQ